MDFRFSNKIWPIGDFRELKRRTHRFLSARLGDHRIIRSAIDGGITSTVITRIDMTEILKQALEAARTFNPLSKETVAGYSLAEPTRREPANTSYSRLQTDTTERRTIPSGWAEVHRPKRGSWHAHWIDGDEEIGQPVSVLGEDPGAFHRYQHLVHFVLMRSDHQFARRTRDWLRRFGCG